MQTEGEQSKSEGTEWTNVEKDGECDPRSISQCKKAAWRATDSEIETRVPYDDAKSCSSWVDYERSSGWINYEGKKWQKVSRTKGWIDYGCSKIPHEWSGYGESDGYRTVRLHNSGWIDYVDENNGWIDYGDRWSYGDQTKSAWNYRMQTQYDPSRYLPQIRDPHAKSADNSALVKIFVYQNY